MSNRLNLNLKFRIEGEGFIRIQSYNMELYKGAINVILDKSSNNKSLLLSLVREAKLQEIHFTSSYNMDDIDINSNLKTLSRIGNNFSGEELYILDETDTTAGMLKGFMRLMDNLSIKPTLLIISRDAGVHNLIDSRRLFHFEIKHEGFNVDNVLVPTLKFKSAIDPIIVDGVIAEDTYGSSDLFHLLLPMYEDLKYPEFHENNERSADIFGDCRFKLIRACSKGNTLSVMRNVVNSPGKFFVFLDICGLGENARSYIRFLDKHSDKFEIRNIECFEWMVLQSPWIGYKESVPIEINAERAYERVLEDLFKDMPCEYHHGEDCYDMLKSICSVSYEGCKGCKYFTKENKVELIAANLLKYIIFREPTLQTSQTNFFEEK